MKSNADAVFFFICWYNIFAKEEYLKIDKPWIEKKKRGGGGVKGSIGTEYTLTLITFFTDYASHKDASFLIINLFVEPVITFLQYIP